LFPRPSFSEIAAISACGPLPRYALAAIDFSGMSAASPGLTNKNAAS
jgi:hypothetical protein